MLRLRGELDPAGDQLLLAALGAVGLGDQRNDVMAGLDEVLERRQGEVAGSEHDDLGRGNHGEVHTIEWIANVGQAF